MLNRTGWTEKLPDDVFRGLCACRNTESDLPVLVNVRWAWMKDQERYRNFTKEDALIHVLELLDSNGQYYLSNLTDDEYNELKREVMV